MPMDMSINVDVNAVPAALLRIELDRNSALIALKMIDQASMELFLWMFASIAVSPARLRY
jgi:hypothetical protein